MFTQVAFAQKSKETKKNVIVFFVDDLGWADVGCYGSSFYETPNIDRLAKEGIRFTDAYAACPVCSPTRASFMTGKYPARLKTTDWFGAPQPEKAKKDLNWTKKKLLPASYKEHLDLEETTIAEVFKANGYKTMIAGKWHLGETENYWPEYQGFDINAGGYMKGSPSSYFSPYNNPRLTDGPRGEYLGDRLAVEAKKFISDNEKSPFFLYFPFYEVHTPMQAKDSLINKYKMKKEALGIKDEFGDIGARKVRLTQALPVYAAMVETMDDIVGQLVDAVKQKGLEENTIVMFFSDNGGLSTSEGSPTSNLPLKAGKGWLYEGGIREPFIIKSLNQVAKNTTCSTPVISNDIFSTLVDMCKLTLDPSVQTDGVSLVPLLNKKSIKRDAIYWHYPHYGNQGGFPGSAIRMGKWKLIHNYDGDQYELYDLSKDLSEKNDLSTKESKIAAQLKTKLSLWLKSVDADMPTLRRIIPIVSPDTKFLSETRTELKKVWPANRSINLVFHGHSVPSGYFKDNVVNLNGSYPAIVLDSLNAKYPYAVINNIRTSIAGENAVKGAARFDQEVLIHKPDVLFIDYALNDRSTLLDVTAQAWESMIVAAKAKGIKVVLLTPTPDLKENILDDNAPLAKYADMIIGLGEKHNVAVIDNYHLFKELAYRQDDLSPYMSQNNHPNAKGHKVVAMEILKLF
jgi:arylsulfatase A-like enzyme/lysophospholipase L1-like esterase